MKNKELSSGMCQNRRPLTFFTLGSILTVNDFHSLQAVGDAFNEGLYERQARLRGIPLLESRPKYQMRNMTAKEACGNQKVVILFL